MTTLARSEVIGPANPKLVAFCCEDSLVVNCYSLEYEIFDISDDAKLIALVKVYPVVVPRRAQVLGQRRIQGEAEPEEVPVPKW